MAGTGAVVHVQGLEELIGTFRLIPEEVSEELTWELEEAAEPARKKSTEFILTGGGGHPGMHNMPPTPVYAGMRIGVSRSEKTVWIAPSWHARSGSGRGRPNISGEFRVRMEAAVEEEKEHIYERVDNMIDGITARHGF
jgi:hypothetical protein